MGHETWISDGHGSPNIPFIPIVLSHSVLTYLSASSIPSSGAGAIPLRPGAYPLDSLCLSSQSNLVTLSSIVNTGATPKFPFKEDLTAQILGRLTARVSSFKSPRDCLSCTEMPSSKSCFCLRVPHPEADCTGPTWDNSERSL